MGIPTLLPIANDDAVDATPVDGNFDAILAELTGGLDETNFADDQILLPSQILPEGGSEGDFMKLESGIWVPAPMPSTAMPYARARQTMSDSMTALEIFVFDTVDFESTGTMVDIGTQPTRITVPEDGIYRVSLFAGGTWGGAATEVGVQAVVNGVNSNVHQRLVKGATGTPSLSISGDYDYELEEGEYVEGALFSVGAAATVAICGVAVLKIRDLI